MSEAKKVYNEKMNNLVATFVDDVAALTREMAREELMRALGPDPAEKHVTKAVKKITKAAKKATKKVAAKTVEKIEKQTKKDTKNAKKRDKKSKSEANRAYALRQKQRSGKKLEDHEVEWLEKYTSKHPSTRLSV